MSDRRMAVVAGIADPDDIRDEAIGTAALRIARRAGGTLHLVHVIEGAAAARAGVEATPAGVADRRALMNRVKERFSRALPGDGPLYCHVRPGEASTELLEAAGEAAAGLIVLGPTRRTTVAGTFLGSTASRVLRGAAAPLLICRSAAVLRRRVLLTTDLTPDSLRALRSGAELLPALGAGDDAELRILLVAGDEVLLPPPLQRIPLRESAEAQLRSFLEQAYTGGLAIEPRVRLGLAAREIVEEAAEWDADLVVVGTRGRTGGERLLLGSVAESVATRAPCDVLAIPPAALGEELPRGPSSESSGAGSHAS